MHFPITDKAKSSLPIHAVAEKSYAAWLKAQPAHVKAWLESTQFKAKPGSFGLLPGKDGALAAVITILDAAPDLWALAHLPNTLPAQSYHLESKHSASETTNFALGWALACYRFTRYKKDDKPFAKLVAPKGCDVALVKSMTAGVFQARSLINTPANDMNPQTLAEEAVLFGQDYKGRVKVIKGEALLKANYPTIYAVGKASSVPPHLVDIRFPNKGKPKVTLVGKGVCFDTGGLDIKSSGGMRLMKKDMAGAAHALALARVILDTKLPVELRLLLPIVENAVAGNAMRPGDIVKTRKGIAVEIDNTDAEGRLILCDALAEADEEEPDLLIDFATLTGAARVALGLDLPAFFTPDDKLANDFMKHATAQNDPVWRMPLWKNYRKQLDSNFADMANSSDSGYAGAITAALYLREFVSKTPSWLHIDMMAWNTSARPGRPVGGEAMAVRALYALLKERYDR